MRTRQQSSMLSLPRRRQKPSRFIWIAIFLCISLLRTEIGANFPTGVFAFVRIGPVRQNRGSYTQIPVVSTAKALSEIASEETESNGRLKPLVIVPPNHGFRNTTEGEVSIASMNLLAPFYNSLQLPQKTTTEYERWAFLDKDRKERVPVAIRMAKTTNADVLCLQEIEGGKLGDGVSESSGREFTLRDDIQKLLAESIVVKDVHGEETTLEGYDSFVWSQLNPNNKRGDVVGLCVVWRSKKHTLVEWQGYKRGMVCQLKETRTERSSFAVANLHLPARPSNVLGRLSTMSRTIRKLSDLDSKIRSEKGSSKTTGLDGLLVVAGDFNSDEHSVAARLLTHGYTNYGNVRDRNYKAKITKASATDMSHPYRFIDSYYHGEDPGSSNDPRFKDGNFRDKFASVTVSLKGRGPGIMDHLFYTTGARKGKLNFPGKLTNTRKNPSQEATKSSGISTVATLSESLLKQHLGGKRSKRRKKGESRGGGAGSDSAAYAARYSEDPNARIQIESILATAESDDHDRLRIIREGLPNLEQGFPSDHLPVGVLFSTTSNFREKVPQLSSIREIDTNEEKPNQDDDNQVDIEPLNIDTKDDHEHRLQGPSSHANSSLPPSLSSSSPSQSSGVSSTVQRRRKNAQKSIGLRRRHNVVLNAMTEWMFGRGASSCILDKPLYKNDLLARTLGPERHQQLKKKSRAPDLVCMVVNDGAPESEVMTRTECLVVVEVAVASDPEKVRNQKQSKYQDLIDILSLSSSDSERNCCFAAIVIGDDGRIADGTRADIEKLARWTDVSSDRDGAESSPEIETERLCSYLQSIVSAFQI